MAIRFDAAADRLLATANLLSNEGPYSWGGDIYWVSATGSDEVLFSLNDDDPDASGNDSRDHIYIKGSDSSLRAFIANGSGGYGFGTGSTLSTGTWYNIFIVRASATDFRVYLNGTLDITVTNDMSGRSSFTRQEIGGFTSTDVQRFNGRVQNILSIDGLALSAEEVMSQSKRFYPIRLGTSTNRWTPAVQTGTDRTADWIGKYSWTVGGTLTDEAGQAKAWGSGQRRHFRSTATAGAQTISSVGAIATAEAFGTAQLNFALSLTGITSAEAFGSPTMVLYVDGAGAIATAEAFGTPALHFTIGLTGITSAEAFGAPTLTIYVDGAGGIATAEAFGTPDVAPTTSVELAGIGTAEAFGSPALHFSLGLAGIASAEAFGVPVFTLSVDAVGAIASAEAFGSPVVSFGLQLAGIASTETFGVPALGFTLLLSGIASAEVFGATIVVGGVQVQPSTLNTFTLTGEVPAFPLAAHSGPALLTGERIVPIEVGE